MTATLRQSVADAQAVLTQAAVRAADLLGLSSSDLAKVIGVSGSTVSRYRQASSGIEPASKTGQLALLLIRVFRSLDPLVGADNEKRRAWMRSHNQALGGVPAQLVQSPDGLVRTLEYLDGMRAAS